MLYLYSERKKKKIKLKKKKKLFVENANAVTAETGPISNNPKDVLGSSVDKLQSNRINMLELLKSPSFHILC